MARMRFQLGKDQAEEKKAMRAILDYGNVEHVFDDKDGEIILDESELADAFYAAVHLFVVLQRQGHLAIEEKENGKQKIFINKTTFINETIYIRQAPSV